MIQLAFLLPMVIMCYRLLKTKSDWAIVLFLYLIATTGLLMAYVTFHTT